MHLISEESKIIVSLQRGLCLYLSKLLVGITPALFFLLAYSLQLSRFHFLFAKIIVLQCDSKIDHCHEFKLGYYIFIFLVLKYYIKHTKACS
jgi:hypothetical protein